MPTLATRLTSAGVLQAAGYFDEVTTTTNRVTPSGIVYSGLFDETQKPYLQFTGSGNGFGWFQGNYLQAVKNNPILGNSPYSVSCWVKIISNQNDGGNGGGGFMYSFGTAASGMSVGLSIQGKTNILGLAHWNNPYDTSTTTALTTGNWYHVVTTYDGTNEKLYVSNSLVLTKIQTSVLNVGSGRFNINKWTNDSKNGLGNSFALSKIGIWNKALTAADVGYLFNAGIKTPYASLSTAYGSLSGAVAFYDLENNVLDNSGNGFNLQEYSGGYPNTFSYPSSFALRQTANSLSVGESFDEKTLTL